MTIKLELTEAEAKQLRDEAASTRLTVEEYALSRLFPDNEQAASEGEIGRTIDYIFEKNAELYRRLS